MTKRLPNKRIKRGAIIRIQKDDKGIWQITQLPEVESAFVAVDPRKRLDSCTRRGI
jgi:penicillin-binding protein 1A